MAQPLCRASSNALWIISAAPTSMPRVGWLAMSTLGPEDISRATTTFWMLPPDRIFTGTEGDLQRTVKRRVSSSASRASFLPLSSSLLPRAGSSQRVET